nr:hypothetical protein [Gammaproteobacteria bacterium]NIR85079.1 hypothetical protein [Gammaproteobacteria bacterium]NIR91943.1 hypothetical protein [Gammaproteobacteria bacterium]NIU03681.1 hypothetical protein [Gammaproteobacteria bacterium]NIX84955.1 hypothetical protein [Gammaproteobacteria bacterium]
MSPGHARCALSLLAPSLIISVPLGLAPAGAADQKLETPVPITDEGRVFSKPLDRPVRVEERSEDSQEESASEDESRDQQRPKSGLEAPELPVEEYERQMKEMRRRVPAHTPEWTDHQESDSGAAAAPPKTRVPAPKTQVPAPKRRALERRLHPRDGSVRFGDGEHGRTPETGGVDAPTYRPGGGAAGAVQ